MSGEADEPCGEPGNVAGADAAKHWKDYATPAEKADLEGLEKNAADLDSKRERLSQAMRLIRDRCIARRRYGGLRRGPRLKAAA